MRITDSVAEVTATVVFGGLTGKMPAETNMRNDTCAKVLLLSVGTGEGHNSAARAIAEVLREKNIECELVDSVSFKSKRSHGFITNGYGQIVRGAPWMFGLAYKIGAAYDSTRLPSPIYAYHKSYADKVYKYLKDGEYNCVICTHLFSMHSVTAIRKQFAPDLPCYGVITDYTAIPFYRGTALDAYFVPDDGTRGMLVKKMIPDEKIHTIGIPVSPKFGGGITKEEAREKLGIDKDKKVIVVSTGGAGCGKIKQLCKKLDKAFDDGYAVYVFTGRNIKLKNKIEKAVGKGGKITPLEFTPDIYLYTKAADLAMGKPGGLSCTEVAVAGIPLVLLKAIPGCETYNKRYFVNHGMAVYCKTLGKAVKAARRVLSDAEYAQTMVNNQRKTVNPHTTDEIVEFVLNDFNSRMSGATAVAAEEVGCAQSEAQVSNDIGMPELTEITV